MAKKQNNKKKVNVKIVSGETFLILDLDIALHIAETYDYLSVEQSEEGYAAWYRDVADSIRMQANQNLYSEDSYEEDWI